jgi:hypothetical protein
VAGSEAYSVENVKGVFEDSSFRDNVLKHPVPMWQKSVGLCESLFQSGLWGWAHDVEGHVSKTIWRSMLTDGIGKCDKDQGNCHNQRAEDEVKPVLRAMAEYVDAHGDGATLHGFIRKQEASQCGSPRSTANALFAKETYCHYQIEVPPEVVSLKEQCNPGDLPVIGEGLNEVGDEDADFYSPGVFYLFNEPDSKLDGEFKEKHNKDQLVDMVLALPEAQNRAKELMQQRERAEKEAFMAVLREGFKALLTTNKRKVRRKDLRDWLNEHRKGWEGEEYAAMLAVIGA